MAWFRSKIENQQSQTSEPRLRDLLGDEKRTPETDNVVLIDLKGVTRADDADISAVMRLHLKLSEAGKRLVLNRVATQLSSQLSMMRMDRMIDIRPDVPSPASTGGAEAVSSSAQRLSTVGRPPILFFDQISSRGA